MGKKASNPDPPKALLGDNMVIKKHFELLGLKAKDKVTGFSGVVDSICFDLYGCIQASLRPPMDSKGELPDGRWFDISRLSITSKKLVMDVPNFGWGIQAEGGQGPAEKAVVRDRVAI